MSDSLTYYIFALPDFAARHLDALLTGHNVVMYFTQPDRPAGRGKVDAYPVKVLAEEKKPARQPVSLRPQESSASGC